MKKEAERQIGEIDKILSQTPFNDINIQIQSYKNQKRLDYEPSWYAPLGVTSVRKMAIDLGRLPEYTFFYSLTSQVMHSSRYRHHIKFDKGKITFEPIRCLKGIYTLINLIVAFVLRTYIAVLEHYRPDELAAFKRRYFENWRTAFRNVKSVRYAIDPERQFSFNNHAFNKNAAQARPTFSLC